MEKTTFSVELKKLRMDLGWNTRGEMSENFYGIPVDTIKNWELARYTPSVWEQELILNDLKRRLQK